MRLWFREINLHFTANSKTKLAREIQQVVLRGQYWKHLTDSWLSQGDVLTLDYDDLWEINCRQLGRISDHLRWPLIRGSPRRITTDSPDEGNLQCLHLTMKPWSVSRKLKL